MSEPVSNNLKYLEDNYKPSEIQKLLSSGKLKKENGRQNAKICTGAN